MPSIEVKASPEGVPGAVSDPARIAAEDLTFAGAGDDQVNGYLARQTGPGKRPAMIVIHEAMGLNEHIRDVTNRFAALGYVALGVDLFTREGGPPPMGDRQAMMERLVAMSDETVLGDLEGAADFLLAREEVDGKIGAVGFCMGGRYTLLFACASDRLDAAVDCWGGFIDKATPEQDSTPERPRPPLELAGELHCPLLAAVGAEDQNPSPQIGSQLRERAGASGAEVKVDVYEGAGHAFFADYRPSYRPGPAAELWGEIVPFLERHLQGR
ncbi:MAG: dienelactone hydrolase family protein [Solirubrobacteraceae bacterium]|jgi:carboxymethylenebutenolidase